MCLLLQQRADVPVQSRYSQMDFSSLLWTSLATVGKRPGDILELTLTFIFIIADMLHCCLPVYPAYG